MVHDVRACTPLRVRVCARACASVCACVRARLKCAVCMPPHACGHACAWELPPWVSAGVCVRARLRRVPLVFPRDEQNHFLQLGRLQRTTHAGLWIPQ